MKMNKERRHFLLKKIIQENEVETQTQLMDLLREEGLSVTQATISRDMKELNVAKTQTKLGKVIYNILSEHNETIQYHKLTRKLQEVVEKIDCVDHMIILKTLPGNAHVIGALLDDMKWEEMLGCICGNDTCVLIVRSTREVHTLYDRLFQKS